MFIDENQPWIGGVERNLSQGPKDIPELRTAIFGSLEKMFGSKKKAIKAIRFDGQHRLAVLRVSLSSLQECGVCVGIGGGMANWLQIHRRNIAPVRISLANFEADAVFENRWIQFRFRLASSTPKNLPDSAYTPTVQAIDRVLKLTQPPLRRVFITRALNALADLSEKSPQKAIEAANTATSDVGVLVRAMVDPNTITNLAPTVDPLAEAKLRGVEAKANLLEAEGGTLTAQKVSEILDISRQAVDKRRQANRLIGLTRGRRGYAYPAWQLRNGETLPGLGDVLAALSRHDAWSQTLFMLNPCTDLDGHTPLAELRAGHVEAVVRAAAQYGEHGAA